MLKDAFRPYVSHYKRIGKYTDAEGNIIDTIIVHLQKGSTLERARTAQRNFVAEYLKTREKDAALVAFLSPDSSDWRLSLVKFETTFQYDKEKQKLKETHETTPAKRWSFLIGENEGNHTVTGSFLKLLQSDQSPNLAELESAFDIETVSEEFYEKYKELFLRMKEALDGLIKDDPAIKSDFTNKEISTADFAKKTMGQLAFLYFLQKKGWFGVVPNADWGTGRKDFLRDLFDRRNEFHVSHTLGLNFFDDIMKSLFYDALASDRRDSADFYNRLNCRMPFLNGGLFEAIQDYDWINTHIRLPDELFSNKNKTKEGDVGDGILDVFDRYNFTVNESEPLEKEVAVDPEMLGKVFENLLEIKDRKSKGAYYTPREIVHYMCQQCLINYLETEIKEQTDIPRVDLEFLIKNGSRIIEHDQTVIEKGRETDTYKYMLPVSIRKQAKLVDSLLMNIKVCDPAVGSGAFPLGMLNEIIRSRAALAVHLHQPIDYFELKKHTIINSLYGVDIDGGAVEIAKLRLWLALVVEENEPHPLPNLECKIMQGNSLISQYEGITLFDETILEDLKTLETEKTEVAQKINSLQSEYFEVHGGELKHDIKKVELKRIEKSLNRLQKHQEKLSDPSAMNEEEMSLFTAPSERRIAHEKSLQLQKLIQQYIETSHNKKGLKAEIDNLKWELIETSLKEQGKSDKLSEIKALRKKHEKPFFLWKLEFSDVFRQKGGFDVVIGNPPYVGEKGNKEVFQSIAKGNLGKFYMGKVDLFYFFFHLSLDLCSEGGCNAFITTNYYITASGAKKLRHDLKYRSIIRNFVNFNEMRIFKSALGQHNAVTIFNKNYGDYADKKKFELRSCIVKGKGFASGRIISEILNHHNTDSSYYDVRQEDLYDGEENYMRPSGLGNADNPIESVLYKINEGNELLGDVANVNIGMRTGADKVSKKHLDSYDLNIEKNTGIYVLTNEEKVELSLNATEKKMFLPWFKNSDIGRYYSSPQNNLWLLNLSFPDTKNIEFEHLPSIEQHINQFKDILTNRRSNDNGLQQVIKRGWWWAFTMRQIDFGQPKIISPQRAKINRFGYNELPWYASMDVYFITKMTGSDYSLKYILALLNSKLYYQWLYHRGKRKGESLELYQKPLSEIPIKKINSTKQKPFIDLVDKILFITSSEDYNPTKPPEEQLFLEAEIDKLVCNLYGLTEDEITLIEVSAQPQKQVAVAQTHWKDTAFTLLSATREKIAPDLYQLAIYPELIRQFGNKLEFSTFRKAYWLLMKPAEFEKEGRKHISEIDYVWWNSRANQLEVDDFFVMLKSSVRLGNIKLWEENGVQYISWIKKDQDECPYPCVIDDARIALLAADLWEDEITEAEIIQIKQIFNELRTA